eukprot:TRINITY_DN50458_c0_g1_i1.p1 TRINITY_DN50458_c0_g1~~TRINITY_DN50458_c0_g1_i1.p1  ORF type:complete len:306 (+),score=48.10 TRINITY_DN50458_c0_g1_i1:137-1054(+)
MAQSPTSHPLICQEHLYWFIFNGLTMLVGYVVGPLLFGSDEDVNSRARAKGEDGSYHSVSAKESDKRKAKKMNNVHDRADIIATLIVLPVLVCLVFADLLSSGRGASEEDRLFGQTRYSVHFLYGYIARQTISCWFIFVGENLRFRDMALMITHHVVSVLAYALTLSSGRLHYYASFDAVCEVTTISLTLMLTFRTLGKDNPKPWYVKVNGLLLWLGFIFLRCVLFPYWLWTWYNDCGLFFVTPQTSTLCMTEATALERYFYPAVTLLLLSMSIFWTIPITQGVLKALGITGSEPAQKGEGKKEH